MKFLRSIHHETCKTMMMLGYDRFSEAQNIEKPRNYTIRLKSVVATE